MISSDVTMTFTLNIPDPVNSFQIPVDVNWVILKNTGSNPIEFKFDDDGADEHYTLNINEKVGPFRVQGGTNFNTNGVGGSSSLEVIAWGWKLKKPKRLENQKGILL